MPPIDSVLGADFDLFGLEVIKDPQRYDALIREARIARMEAVCLLSALARHVSRIELAGTPETTANMAVHGHERLPLRLVPA